MYCPNCSSEASTEQKFCRSCGMELQQTWGKPKSRKPLLQNTELTINQRPALLSEEHPSVTEFTTEFLEASEARAKAPDTAPQNE